MFFLLRCIFWLALVFIVAPMLFPNSAPTTDPVAQAAHAVARSADAAAAQGATASVVEGAGQVASFCSDNGAVCEGAFGALTRFGEALGQGIDLLAGREEGTGPAAARGNQAITNIDPAMRGTLTATDRAVPWHGAAQSDPQG